jgi:hypothetical protein
MSNSLISLKETAPNMHPYRVLFEMTTVQEWYKVIHEANALYGVHNWRGQPRVKRKLENNAWLKKTVPVWFDVPDPAFASWVSVKHSLIARNVVTK